MCVGILYVVYTMRREAVKEPTASTVKRTALFPSVFHPQWHRILRRYRLLQHLGGAEGQDEVF